MDSKIETIGQAAWSVVFCLVDNVGRCEYIACARSERSEAPKEDQEEPMRRGIGRNIGQVYPATRGWCQLERFLNI